MLRIAKLKKYTAIALGMVALTILAAWLRASFQAAPVSLAISQPTPLVEQIAELLPDLPPEVTPPTSDSALAPQALAVNKVVPQQVVKQQSLEPPTPVLSPVATAQRPQTPLRPSSTTPKASKIAKIPSASGSQRVAYRLSKPAQNAIAQRYQSIAQRTGYLESYPEVAAAELVAYQGQYLTADSAAAFEKMRVAADQDGITLKVISGFRSIATQVSIFDGKGGGLSAAEYSAPPGHSQHHTGLAIDINSLQPSFQETKAFAWLRQHAKTYGFMLPYTAGSGDVGPRAEPWHWVYVGKPAAMKLMAGFVERARQYTRDPFLGDRQLEKIYQSIS